MTYTVRDICNRYGVHEHTVLAWIHNGELKAVNVGREPGKKKARWRITDEALSAFEALRSTTPPPPPQTRRRKRLSIQTGRTGLRGAGLRRYLGRG